MNASRKPAPAPIGAAAQSRREFMAASAKTAALFAVAGLGLETLPPGQTRAADATASAVKPVVGSQLYGWGQYYDRDKRNLFEHLDEVLSALRDAGYDYAEGNVDSNAPDNNGRFADRLRQKGLQPVSLYTGGRLHEAGPAAENVRKIVAAAKVCAQAGFSVINCNVDPIGREKTDAELANQVAALKDLAAGLKDLGLRLGIHHHTPELHNHAREFHYNFKNAPAGLVDFCFDVHWVYRGGLAPMEALTTYADRVVSWHLRQSREGTWWEDLDEGDVDYKAIAAYASQHRIPPRYSVELALEGGTKITRSVVENHKRSRDYVRKVFGC